MAKFLGVNPIDAWFGLCTTGRVKIVCCHGTAEERNAAFVLLNTRKDGFIIDPITLYTLFILNVHNEVLIFSGGKLGITQSTLDLFRMLIETRKTQSAHSSMGKQGDQFYLEEVSEDKIKESIKPFEELMAWCKVNCEIVAAVGKKILSEEDKKILTCFDTAFIDTLFAAEGSGRLLLSDDLRYRQYAKLMFDINGVWTQPLLHMAVAKGIVSREKYNDSIIHLLDLNYYFIYIMSENMFYQTQLNSFEAKGDLLKILATFGSKDIELISVIEISADFLIFVWNNYTVFSKKEKLTYAILNALGNNSQRDMERIILLLHCVMCRRMVIDNAFAEQLYVNIKATFVKWCSGHFLFFNTLGKIFSKNHSL